MYRSTVNIIRYAFLLGIGFVLGLIALTLAAATKGTPWYKMSMFSTANSKTLADTSCSIPGKDTNNEVYFVSCGGFF